MLQKNFDKNIFFYVRNRSKNLISEYFEKYKKKKREKKGGGSGLETTTIRSYYEQFSNPKNSESKRFV